MSHALEVNYKFTIAEHRLFGRKKNGTTYVKLKNINALAVSYQ